MAAQNKNDELTFDLLQNFQAQLVDCLERTLNQFYRWTEWFQHCSGNVLGRVKTPTHQTICFLYSIIDRQARIQSAFYQRDRREFLNCLQFQSWTGVLYCWINYLSWKAWWKVSIIQYKTRSYHNLYTQRRFTLWPRQVLFDYSRKRIDNECIFKLIIENIYQSKEMFSFKV